MTGPPSIGSMRLLDSATPSLPDDTYTMTVATTVNGSGGPFPLSGANPSASFTIAGPRFVLPAADVSSTYPPDKGVASFAGLLPHVVLTRQTLPWERGWTGPATAPWLALLLFTPDDLAAGLYTAPALVTGVEAAVGTEAYGSLSSDPSLSNLDKITCTAMSVRSDLLSSILPTPADGTLLCHVRQVNPSDVTSAGDPDGLFSVVVANRMPVTAGTHLACLISLDERDDLQQLVAGTDVVPLLVLYSWTFEGQDTGGSFGEIIGDVDAQPIAIGRSQPVAISYLASDGTTSTVAYHGPLVSDPPPSTAADPTSFPMQAANEFGRLIAAADEGLLRAIANWRADSAAATAAADVAVSLRGVATEPAAEDDAASAPAPGGGVREALATIADRYLGAAHAQPLADAWRVPPAVAALHGQKGSALAESARVGERDQAPPDVRSSLGAPPRRLPRVLGTPPAPTAAGAAAPAGRPPSSAWRPRPHRLTGSGGDRRLVTARRRSLAVVAAVPPPPRVAAFRDDILALQRIPLAQMLPDPTLLPDESVRFFYLDPDWLNQLLAGACSVGAIGTSSQSVAAAAARALVASPADNLELDPAPSVVTGFLLRSKLLSGWPETVVRAFATAPADTGDPSTAQQLTPIRLERLNPSLLLALFPGRPAVVWIEEPLHAIRHAVDPIGTEYQIVPGQATGAAGTPVPVPLRPAPPEGTASVIDIAALADSQAPQWSPGQLAAQLLRKPHRHIYRLS